MFSRPITAALFGLAVLFFSSTALAQKVVILEFDGDRRGALRTQVIRALTDAGEVEFVPLKEFQREAARAGFKGRSAQSPRAVAEVSKSVSFAAVVDGRVTRGTFSVVILDSQGVELWSKDLPVKRGLISSKNAQRLAKAIAAGASTVQASQPAPEEPAVVEETEEEAPAEQEAQAEETDGAQTLPGLDVSGEESAEARERRLREAQEETHTQTGTPAHRDEDLEERRRPRARHVGPKMITLMLGGTTTWRAYCSRPGVQSCKQYDDTPEAERPAGDTVDFSPQVPYAGFGLGLEFFPLASLDNPLNGLGILVGFSRGFSLTRVRIQTPGGEAPEKEVVSVDDAWHAQGAWRYYFGMGSSVDPLVGYVGLRGGLAARTFEVDPDAEAPLPGSHRRYPVVGVDVSIPLAKIARIEAGGSYFIDPVAGVDEIAGYGSEASGSGFGIEAGLAGDIWGPIGYSLKFRLSSYKDLFTGQGGKWANGGAAEETYTAVFWGATAAF